MIKTIIVLSLLLFSSSLSAKEPIHVGCEKQLFIDTMFIGKAENVKLTVNPPIKAGIAIPRDKLWESAGILGGMVTNGLTLWTLNKTQIDRQKQK